MDERIHKLEVENFRNLRKMSLPLRPLNVLVGPNGAGKTNVLEVFRFLADIIRADLQPALDLRREFDEVVFWGGGKPPASIRVRLKATWTKHSSVGAPDEYELRVTRRTLKSGEASLSRREMFHFQRARGRGRRITITGQKVSVSGIGPDAEQERRIGIRKMSSGLSTLPRLADQEVATLAERLASFRVFDVDVSAARRPARFPRREEVLHEDTRNLSAFLLALRSRDEEVWQHLVQDAVSVLPYLEGIDFEFPSGAAREVVAVLRERGLRRPTRLADASYGTMRLLGLLALLYDPEPPTLTCVEEIDHGLHPQAFELLVDRLRDAGGRTQFLITTHSPALADRLRPEEIVICERSDDGSSVIPAMPTNEIQNVVAAGEGLPLGELCFSGGARRRSVRRGSTRVRATNTPVILLVGDEANDRQGRRPLVEESCPAMRSRLVESSKAVRLRQASGENLADRVDQLGRAARAKVAQQHAEPGRVRVHEDFDAAAATGIRRRTTGCIRLRVASSATRITCRRPPRFERGCSFQMRSRPSPRRGSRPRSIGARTPIADPKRVMMSEAIRAGRRYRESEAPNALVKAIELGGHKRPAGPDRSWRHFNDDVTRCCTGHLRSTKG